MKALTDAPFQAPICPGAQNHQGWQQWLQKALPVLVRGTQKQTIQDTTGKASCTIVEHGTLLTYSYTGVGGVTFNRNGTVWTIPASTASQTTTATIIMED